MTEAHNSPVTDSQIINLLKNDLELFNVASVSYLGKKDLFVSKQLFEQIQTLPQEHTTVHKWLVKTDSEQYLLIGCELSFFSEKQSNDPFEESDDFEEFAGEIGKLLEGQDLPLYISDDGFYYSKLESGGKTYSFFAYKL